MPLPILSSSRPLLPSDLLRLYVKTELNWSRQVATEQPMEAGTVLINAELPDVYHANCVFDAELPGGVSPVNAVEEVRAVYQRAGVQAWRWVMNASAPAARTESLAQRLIEVGCTRAVEDVFYLAESAMPRLACNAELQIIPARASFRHAREIVLESEADDPVRTPQLSVAMMQHLDDPQTDALLAIRKGIAVAYAAVLSVGEVGLIAQLYVSTQMRRQGIGCAMLSRVIEICGRSLFRHVFLNVSPANHAARSLYERFGFRKLGEHVSYSGRLAGPAV